jgi:flagellar biosynthesis/type III secretory pathway protein FliH
MRAERALKRISLTERLWDWKYAREKRAWDYASVMDAVREQGLAEGRAQGLEQGEAKGRQETEAEYRREIEELRRKLREAGVEG